MKKIIKSMVLINVLRLFFMPQLALARHHSANLSAAFATHPSLRHHPQALPGNLNVSIQTVLVPTAQGYSVFNEEFNPIVTDSLSGFNGSFQNSAPNGVWPHGCYEIGVFPDADARAIASSTAMSSAPSVRKVNGVLGQGIAMSSTGYINQGYLNVGLTTAPIKAIGAGILAAPADSTQAYPRILGATVLLETGDLVDVEIASLTNKEGDGGMPETTGQDPNNVSGYGFVGLQSDQPIRAIQFWFANQHEAPNALYWGGNVRLYADLPLIYAPNAPSDQIGAIVGNPNIYSAVALLPLETQSVAVNQVLGVDHITQLHTSVHYALSNILRASGSLIPIGMAKTKLWVQPTMVRQNRTHAQSTTTGLWAGWDYQISDHFSGGIVGGVTHSKTQLTGGQLQQTARYGGISLSARWNKEDIGPSITHQIFFSQSHHNNFRTVPIFHYQANQKYSGSSMFSVTQIKWVLALPGEIQITPYGLFMYDRNRHNAFDEAILSWSQATSSDRQVAQSAALHFNLNFARGMVQEGGVMFKKQSTVFTNTSCDLWLSAAMGGTQSLKQTLYSVGFVKFTPRFSISAPPKSTLYFAPMAGVTLNFSSGLQLSFGGRYQKTIKTVSIDPATSWSIWCVIQKAL